MIPPIIPPEIDYRHRALLAALRVDYFRPGLGDLTAWHDFLFVLETLTDSEGGELQPEDIHAAVNLMRAQNKSGEARWSLRFAKIMREPESFRDLVLIARKKVRQRPPVETASRTDATGASVAIERDPAAVTDPQPISEGVRHFMSELAARKARRTK
jgi:hypothetical protein